jgi:hypothetical protein
MTGRFSEWRELGQPLLQLLLVVVGSGLFDLGLDLGNSCLCPAEVEGEGHDANLLLYDHYLASVLAHEHGGNYN